MKKFIIAFTAMTTMALTGCVTTGSSDATTAQTGAVGVVGTATQIGRNVLQTVVDNQCRSQLRSNNAFRLVALAMSAEQQDALEGNICGCVSEHAPQSVTVVDLAQAATDATARTQIAANAVQKTLTACYAKFVK